MPGKIQCRLSVRKWTAHYEVIIPNHQNTDHAGSCLEGADRKQRSRLHNSVAASGSERLGRYEGATCTFRKANLSGVGPTNQSH